MQPIENKKYRKGRKKLEIDLKLNGIEASEIKK